MAESSPPFGQREASVVKPPHFRSICIVNLDFKPNDKRGQRIILMPGEGFDFGPHGCK